MNRVWVRAFLIGCLGIVATSAASEEEIIGDWVLKEMMRGREVMYAVTIADNGGTWSDENGSSPLRNVKIDGDSLSFERVLGDEGDEISVRYGASLANGVLVGQSTSSRGVTTFTAMRSNESGTGPNAKREATIAALDPCDILALFAHPDDETFATGTFAKLSASGQRIQLVYATSGDAGGDRTGQGLSGAALAEAREEEMNNAAGVLEVSAPPIFLRYPDGFVREYWNDILSNVESILDATRPRIVVTFGPDGYYGHRDHLAISQIAERAFDKHGVASHLLHVAIPKSINDRIAQAGGGSPYQAVNDKYITYIVNVKKQTHQRVGAMEAHRSQFDEATVRQMRLLGGMTGYEGFVEVRNLGEAGTLADLFSAGDDERGR